MSPSGSPKDNKKKKKPNPVAQHCGLSLREGNVGAHLKSYPITLHPIPLHFDAMPPLGALV